MSGDVMPGHWASSTRADRLPRNWAALRARILRRDPTCVICRATPSREVDHITPGDNHDPANLQGLCHTCHQTKTIREREAARPQRRRPQEPHPGLLDT